MLGMGLAADVPTLALQIRGLCTADIGIITTSRDKTAKIWAEESSTTYNVLQTLVGVGGAGSGWGAALQPQQLTAGVVCCRWDTPGM
jgi:hypothetical protein